MKDLSHFVAFSEYPNFTNVCLTLTCLEDKEINLWVILLKLVLHFSNYKRGQRTKKSIYESSFWNYFSNQFCKSYFFNYKCLPDLEVDKEINLWVILLKLLFISVLQIIFFRLQMFAWPWGRQRYTFFPHIVSAVIC